MVGNGCVSSMGVASECCLLYNPYIPLGMAGGCSMGVASDSSYL